MTFQLEPLPNHHDLSGFACGNPECDDWLRRHARTATGQGTCAFLLVAGDDDVVGYFSVAPHTIERDQRSKKSGRGTPSASPRYCSPSSHS